MQTIHHLHVPHGVTPFASVLAVHALQPAEAAVVLAGGQELLVFLARCGLLSCGLLEVFMKDNPPHCRPHGVDAFGITTATVTATTTATVTVTVTVTATVEHVGQFGKAAHDGARVLAHGHRLPAFEATLGIRGENLWAPRTVPAGHHE